MLVWEKAKNRPFKDDFDQNSRKLYTTNMPEKSISQTKIHCDGTYFEKEFGGFSIIKFHLAAIHPQALKCHTKNVSKLCRR